MTPPRQKVAVLGLGAMGSRMAGRLIAAGHDVTVFNRSERPAEKMVELGATRADTPRAAARGCDVVIGCVSNDDASRALWLADDTGALQDMGSDSIAVESSTLTPGCVRELAAAAEARGVEFLDAPVVGSRPQAEAGQLVYLVGGDAAAVERVRPVLETLGSAIHHAGPTSCGSVLKLAVNSLLGIQVAAFAELLAWVDKAGIEPNAAAEILSSLAVTSPAARGAMGLMVAGDHAPMFPIALVTKDLRYAETTATDLGAEVPTLAAVRRVFERAQAEGQGSANITGVSKLFE